MSPKVAVVTGSNQGIGLAIIRGLCKRFDGVVYLTSLYEDQGADAIATLKKEGFHPKYHQLDITDIKSITKFRDHIKEHYEHIDLLVNNAAIAFKTNAPEPAAVQAEKTLHVNYFSTVLLCEVLFPLLRNGARVVNMSSSYGHLSRIPSEKLRDRLKDPNLTISQLSELMNDFVNAAKEGRQVKEWGNSSYVVSKVGVAALTRIQQRLVNDRDIKVNAVHPGYVRTDMSSHTGEFTVEEGASAPLYLALDAPNSVRGAYVWCDSTIVDWEGKNPEFE